LRDPQALGEFLLAVKEQRPGVPLSVIADMRGAWEVQVYDPQPTNHAATREAELRARAEAGDRFAEAMLRGETLAEDPVD